MQSCNLETILSLSKQHVDTTALREDLIIVFLFIEGFSSVRDLYSSASLVGKDRTFQEQEELFKLNQDGDLTLVLSFMTPPLH